MIRFLAIILFFQFQFFLISQEEKDKLSIEPKGGLFKDSVYVQIKGSGEIYYTLDGRLPTKASKKHENGFYFSKSTVLRVAQFVDGKLTSEKTNSYIIGRNFDMAVISIAGDPNDFFGFASGIFSKGCCADSFPPYKGANFWKKWEKPINIEMFEPDGEIAFNQKAGAKVFGGFSRGMPMKSLAIHSRKKYQKKYFKHPIFPKKEIKKYKAFVLRNSGSDFNITHFRDALVTDLTIPLGIEIQSFRPAVVFINGEYWGLYNMREKINEHFLKGNCGVDPNNIDFIHHKKDLVHGSRKHYDRMLSFMKFNDMNMQDNIDSLSKLMDIDNFINYNITQVYIDNGDAGGNIRFWRPSTEDGKWRWILFDTDISFGRLNWNAHKINTLQKMTTYSDERWPNPAWSTFIIRKLLENDSIKNVYINRLADHLNTVYSSKNVLLRIDSIKNLYNKEMPYHVEKWKSNTISKWERNVNVLKKFASKRPAYLRKFTMQKFGIKDTLNIQVSTSEFGHVMLNSLLIKDTFSGVYFKNIPIKIEAVPADDYVFSHWKGIQSNENPIQIEPLDSLQIEPVYAFKDLSKFHQKVVINELGIQKNSGKGFYLELYNNSKKPINLRYWKIIINGKKKNLRDTAEIPQSGYYVFESKSKLKLKKDQPKEILIELYDNEGFKVDSLYYIINNQKELKKSKYLVIERIFTKQIITQKNLHFSLEPSPGKVNNITLLKSNKANSFWSTWNLLSLIFCIIISCGAIVYFIKRGR